MAYHIEQHLNVLPLGSRSGTFGLPESSTTLHVNKTWRARPYLLFAAVQREGAYTSFALCSCLSLAAISSLLSAREVGSLSLCAPAICSSPGKETGREDVFGRSWVAPDDAFASSTLGALVCTTVGNSGTCARIISSLKYVGSDVATSWPVCEWEAEISFAVSGGSLPLGSSLGASFVDPNKPENQPPAFLGLRRCGQTAERLRSAETVGKASVRGSYSAILSPSQRSAGVSCVCCPWLPAELRGMKLFTREIFLFSPQKF